VGKRGPQPLLKLRLNGLTPIEFDHSCPTTPDWLDEFGKEFLERHAKLLHSMGILTIADTDALALAAMSYSVCRRTLVILQKNENMESKNGTRLPQAKLYKDAQTNLLQYLREFGLTPASRAKMAVESTGGSIYTPEDKDILGI
jgi:P27 family predicted phage terminase small subunit